MPLTLLASKSGEGGVKTGQQTWFSAFLIKLESYRFNYRSSKKSYHLFSIHLKITLLLLLLTPFELGCAVCTQQAVFGQDSFGNTSGETADRLDTIIESIWNNQDKGVSTSYTSP